MRTPDLIFVGMIFLRSECKHIVLCRVDGGGMFVSPCVPGFLMYVAVFLNVCVVELRMASVADGRGRVGRRVV